LNVDVLADTEHFGIRGKKIASDIGRAAERMERIIDDLIDHASIQSGRLIVERKPVASSQIVRDTLEMFAPIAAQKQLRLQARAGDDINVLGDRQRALQILSNLVGNALKFTPPGGQVTITVEPSASEARFAVADTGPGMSPEDIVHIWERFWRKDEGQE